MEVTTKTNINSLLETYPELEEFLMKLNKKYKKLKNPVLRRTVARIATLSQVARIGGYEPLELTNIIRKKLGQKAIDDTGLVKEGIQKEKPSWIEGEPSVVVNGNEMLDGGKNPLAEINKILKTMKPGEFILLKTDFLPSPMIDTFQEQGQDTWSEEISTDSFETYILKVR